MLKKKSGIGLFSVFAGVLCVVVGAIEFIIGEHCFGTVLLSLAIIDIGVGYLDLTERSP